MWGQTERLIESIDVADEEKEDIRKAVSWYEKLHNVRISWTISGKKDEDLECFKEEMRSLLKFYNENKNKRKKK